MCSDTNFPQEGGCGSDPVFIVILGCEKHVQLLICIYSAVLCDIMLRAPLSSIVNRSIFPLEILITLGLNDRQPVNVFKTLNDRQSGIFLKF